MKNIFTELLAALLTGALGFFCAGAIYLPIAADYLGRVLFTLGGMSLVYGGESVLRLGHVKACTIDFSVGKCTEHNLVVPSLVLWVFFYALWRLRVWRKNPQDNNLRKPAKNFPELSDTLRKPATGIPKLSYAAVAGIGALLFGAWILLRPTAFSHTSFGYPLRLALTLSFGALLYKASSAQIVGTTQRLVVQMVLSAAIGFFGTGLAYQLQVWSPPLDSPIDALFSLITETMTAGFRSVLYLGSATNSLIAAFLLWTTCFAWLRWRSEKRFAVPVKRPIS
jgi:hypothetical protein